MKPRLPVLIFSSWIILASVSLVSGFSLSCPNCYVGNCQCTTDCDLGYLAIYKEDNCWETELDTEWGFSGGTVTWTPEEEKTYKAKIFCDDPKEMSDCKSFSVTSPGVTTTTSSITTTTYRYPPRPRPSTTISSTTSTTTSSSTTPTTTTTSSSTSSITTTLRETTSTALPCDNNGVCEPGKGENYDNCPEDCPSGSADGYCDQEEDGKCDPDCLSWEDKDCRESECGNGKCESELGENYENCPEDCKGARCGDGTCNWMEGENYIECPEDCPSGSKDGYCDGREDGKCDPDCKEGEDLDCGGDFSSTVMSFLPYILGLLFLILVVLILLKRRGKKAGEENRRVLKWVKKKLKEGEDPEILRRGLREEGLDPGLVDRAEEKLWS